MEKNRTLSLRLGLFVDLTCFRKYHAENSKQPAFFSGWASLWIVYRLVPCHLNYITHVNKDGGSKMHSSSVYFEKNDQFIWFVALSFYWCYEIHVSLKTISAQGFEKQKRWSRNKCLFYDLENFCVQPLLFLWITLVKIFIFFIGCFFSSKFLDGIINCHRNFFAKPVFGKMT